jgi:hypothetical protein
LRGDFPACERYIKNRKLWLNFRTLGTE